MSWLTKTLTSSIGKKLVMSLTGIFLILFLTEHLIGNLLLLKPDEGLAFNEYAHFMKENLIIRIAEVGLFAGFLLHIYQGIVLIRSNRSARPVQYSSNKSRTDNWASKLMGPFGIVILIFLVVHLYNFFSYKYFRPQLLDNVAGTEIPDMAAKVFLAFSNPLEVGLYVVAMLVVAFHLWHGFQSAFQSLGINHKKYTPFIQGVGAAFSIIIPLAMAAIPVIIFLRS